MRINPAVPVAVAVFSSILLCAPLNAQMGRGGGGGGGGQSQAQQAAQQAAQQKAAEKAAAIADAEAKVSDATKALNVLVKKMTADFNASPDLLAAQAKVVAAGKAYDDAKAPVIAALTKSNPTYKASAAKLATLQTKLETQQKNHSPSASDTSQQIFDLGNVMGPLERTAVEKDPACIAAKKDLDEAVAAVAKMTADFKAGISSNSDYTAAKSTLDSAKGDLATAKAM